MNNTHKASLQFLSDNHRGKYVPDWVLRYTTSEEAISSPHAAAIFLSQALYWLTPTKDSKTSSLNLKTSLFEEDTNWVYKEIKEWAEETYIKERTLKRIIDDLCTSGILIRKTKIIFGGRKLCLSVRWDFLERLLIQDSDPLVSLAYLKHSAQVSGDWSTFLREWYHAKNRGADVEKIMPETEVSRLKSKVPDWNFHENANLALSYTDSTKETTPSSHKEKSDPNEGSDSSFSLGVVDHDVEECVRVGSYLLGDPGFQSKLGKKLKITLTRLVTKNILTPDKMKLLFEINSIPDVRNLFPYERWSELIIDLDKNPESLNSLFEIAIDSGDCDEDLRSRLIPLLPNSLEVLCG